MRHITAMSRTVREAKRSNEAQLHLKECPPTRSNYKSNAYQLNRREVLVPKYIINEFYLLFTAPEPSRTPMEGRKQQPRNLMSIKQTMPGVKETMDKRNHRTVRETRPTNFTRQVPLFLQRRFDCSLLVRRRFRSSFWLERRFY